jgi:surface antigen
MNIRIVRRALAIGIVGAIVSSAIATARTVEAGRVHMAPASTDAMASAPIHPTYEWRYHGGPKGGASLDLVGQ